MNKHDISIAFLEKKKIARGAANCGQSWSDMNQDYVTAFPIYFLKCFQKHISVYCLAVIWQTLWPSEQKGVPQAFFSVSGHAAPV